MDDAQDTDTHEKTLECESDVAYQSTAKELLVHNSDDEDDKQNWLYFKRGKEISCEIKHSILSHPKKRTKF